MLVRHEAGGRSCGRGLCPVDRPRRGVLLVTSGPGATNFSPALPTLLMILIPIVLHRPPRCRTHLIGSTRFRNAETVGITRHRTKHNYLVKRIEDLPVDFPEAFSHVASSRPPGPVVIDSPGRAIASGTYTGPRNVQHKTYSPVPARPILGSRSRRSDSMVKAKRPVFYWVAASSPRTRGLDALARTGAIDRVSHYVDFDGPPPLVLRQALVGDAWYARHLRSQIRDARLRPNRSRRVPALMIGSPADFIFRPGLQENSYRYRSQFDYKNVKVDLGIIGDCAHVLQDLIALWRSVWRWPLPPWRPGWKQIDAWRSIDLFPGFFDND